MKSTGEDIFLFTGWLNAGWLLTLTLGLGLTLWLGRLTLWLGRLTLWLGLE